MGGLAAGSVEVTDTYLQLSINRDEYAPFAMAAAAGNRPARALGGRAPGVTVQSSGPLSPYAEAGVDLAVGYHAAVDAISLMPDAATRRERRAAGMDADMVDAVQEPTRVTSERVDPVPGATVLEAELVEEDTKRDKATARPDPDIVDADIVDAEVVSETPSARPEPRKPIALLEAAKSAPDAAPQPPAREQAPAATYPPAVTAGKALTTGATASAAPAAGGTPSAQSSVPAVATAQQVTNGQNAVSPSDGAGRNPAGGRTQVGGHGQDREAQQRKKLRT